MNFLKLLLTINLFLFLTGCYAFRTYNNLDLSIYLPEKLNFCDSQMDSSHTEYKELNQWFRSNTNNWIGSPVSFVVGNIYEGENMHINILDSLVVVNFTDNEGNEKQITHKKYLNELKHVCNQN